jgi:flagella basal body P-ring formation protein FlgA
VLVDNLDDYPLLDVKQVVAQQAARELKPGTVMRAKAVQPVPLARSGQFVTVTLSRGSVTVKTVARAMEEGSYGQTIRVKNEGTKDVYQVTLTGPQEATMGPPPTAEAAAR